MDKKAYIAPTMEAVNVEVAAMIATSVFVSNSTTNADASMGREHRGNWDDIW